MLVQLRCVTDLLRRWWR